MRDNTNIESIEYTGVVQISIELGYYDYDTTKWESKQCSDTRDNTGIECNDDFFTLETSNYKMKRYKFVLYPIWQPAKPDKWETLKKKIVHWLENAETFEEAMTLKTIQEIIKSIEVKDF